MKITKIPSSRTGIFVIVCFSLLVIGLFLIGDKQKLFSNTSTYYVKFREVNNLKTGAMVLISGINVGSVHSIDLPKKSGDSVLVSIHIVKDAINLIHTDSKATVTTVGLVGDKVVSITTGSASSALVPKDGLITGESQRDLMGVVDTVMAAIDAIKDLTEQANDMFTDIRSGKGTVGKLLTDEGLYKDIRAIVTNSDKSIASITSTARQLQITIDSALGNFSATSTEFRELGHTLNSGKGSIGRLLNDTEIYAKLLDLSQSISTTVTELRDAMTKISTASGNTAEVTEALKHNFLVKDYFEDRGYWDASKEEQKIKDRIDTLKKIESNIDLKLKQLRH
jgi:phospholipid/cholesterol/gamma-HCH transport system substrate-binding protein